MHYNMSTTNNTKKTSDTAPWKDWKPDLEFLLEANKYCKVHKQTFTTMIGDIIEKVKKGVDLFGDILVSPSHLFLPAQCLMIHVDSLMPQFQFRVLLKA